MSIIIAFVVMIFYLAIFVGVLYMIYTWVNKFLALKKEHNELLREILKKLGEKTGDSV